MMSSRVGISRLKKSIFVPSHWCLLLLIISVFRYCTKTSQFSIVMHNTGFIACLRSLENGWILRKKFNSCLESAWKQIRYLKVLEKSLNLNLQHVESLHLFTVLKQTLVCISPVLAFSLPAYLTNSRCNLSPACIIRVLASTVQYASVSHCSLNFDTFLPLLFQCLSTSHCSQPLMSNQCLPAFHTPISSSAEQCCSYTPGNLYCCCVLLTGWWYVCMLCSGVSRAAVIG